MSRYFRDRPFPRFFADGEGLRSAATRVREERPEWVQRTIETARRECNEGLELYARTGPSLDQGFPWHVGQIALPDQDRLYRIRPHRFGFAPRLALAALYGMPADSVLEQLLLDWMRVAASRDNGPAYESNLVVIQRLLALSWAWAFLSAREKPGADHLRQEGLVLQVIRSDVDFLTPRLGSSVPNNHLLADGFAGWFIGTVWPDLSPKVDLRNRFEPLWLQELSRQTLADGTSFEHSTHYHEYACEMAAAYVILSRRNERVVPDWVLDRFDRMLEFQSALAGLDGITVAIGDAAEDPLFPLDNGNGWGTGAWRPLHRALYASRLSPPSRDIPSEERAFWLLGGTFPENFRPPQAGEQTGLASFPNGGFYVLHDKLLSSRLVFRTGPTTEQAIFAGHVHSDLLSVCLSSGGHPFLVDAGTYTYRRGTPERPSSELDFRRYFRGPEAHNGLSLDALDAFGDVKGDFRRDSIETFVSARREQDGRGGAWVDALVVGRGVYASHRRGVVQIAGEYWVLYDVLPSWNSRSPRSFGFQFAPECEVRRMGTRTIQARNGGNDLSLVGSPGLAEPHFLAGSVSPPGGWVSRRYGELVPATQARFEIERPSTATAFLLKPGGLSQAASVELETITSDGIRIKIAVGNFEDTLLVNLRSNDDELDSGDIRFRGRLVWVRSVDGKPSQLRWLNGSLLDSAPHRIRVIGAGLSTGLEITTDGGVPTILHGDRDELSIEWPE